MDADIYDADIYGANLKSANLKSANLRRVKALGTNFSRAILTGACIQDWNINSETNLENVICDYIYLKKYEQKRRPFNPKRNFEPGEFAKLVQKTVEAGDLSSNKNRTSAHVC
ncbi:MAG: pentapeptide repeat-containing protein [Symploca sp. SIO1C4]|uniref:Pentapeptide repeat-containing protein n=1 Tax=Symploca sp. SIO1C4 TaxID=2607765 RepID=A0A6B3NPV3_9CYAN|nr:pentapeptide repeat-containing protein [Symploca sp. SIO1C4]